MSETDYQLLMQIEFGEDREDIARWHGTTRANIDQRVSRLRRLLAEGRP